MNTKESDKNINSVEKPDNWWYRIYAAVFITTIFVIAGLAAFSKYFL